MDFWAVWVLVKKRRFVFVGVSALTLALLLVISQVLPNQYRSSAKLIVNPSHAVSDVQHEQQVEQSDWRSNYQVVKTFMQSELFLQRVGHRSGLDLSTGQLRSMLTFKQLAGAQGETNIIQVDVTGGSPDSTFHIADAFVNEFVDFIPTFSAEEFTRNAQFLKRLVSAAEAELRAARNKQAAWQEKNQVLDVQSESSSYVNSVAKLEAKRQDSKREVEAAEADVNALQSYLAASDTGAKPPPWEVLDGKNTLIPQMQADLAAKQEKLSELKTQFLANDPPVVKQQTLVDASQKLLEAEKRDYVQSLLANRQATLLRARGKYASDEASFEALKRTWKLAKNNLEFNNLTQQVTGLQASYQNLLAQYQAALISEQNAKREGSIQILETPQPGALVPSLLSKEVQKSLPLLIPFSLLAGALATYVAESLAASFSVRTRISQQMDLPLVGVIPKAPQSIIQRWEGLRDEIPVNAMIQLAKSSKDVPAA